LNSSEKNELSCAISNPFNCYQGVIVKDIFRFEKNKINRQYFRAAAFSSDEAGYILHYQHYFYKVQDFPPQPGRYRTMGNVYVYQWAPDIFLGHGYNSIASSSVPQE
jgi:hypothetical protein